MTSVADLEAELRERERARYRRLQDAALAREFTRREGHPPASRADIVARWPGQLVPMLDPARYLSPAEIAAALASLATGCTATG